MADPRRTRASSGSPWEARAGYSRAIRAGSHVFVSGTVGRNADGSVPASPYAQARRALEIIVEALHELDAGVEHIVRTRMFVTDIGHLEDVVRAHAEVLGDVSPSTTLVEVSGLVDDAYAVEIEADAIVG